MAFVYFSLNYAFCCRELWPYCCFKDPLCIVTPPMTRHTFISPFHIPFAWGTELPMFRSVMLSCHTCSRSVFGLCSGPVGCTLSGCVVAWAHEFRPAALVFTAVSVSLALLPTVTVGPLPSTDRASVLVGLWLTSSGVVLGTSAHFTVSEFV